MNNAAEKKTINHDVIVDMVQQKMQNDLGEALSKRVISAVLKASEAVIMDSLSAGAVVNIRGFMHYESVFVEAYKGRNPSTGEPLTIPSKYKIRLKAGTQLRDSVNT